VNGISKVPFLMSALESDVKTDLPVNDLKQVYDWGSQVPESRIVHAALTDQNLLNVDTCGPSFASTLCPEDPTYLTLHAYFGALNIDPRIVAEKAPVRFANASISSYDLGDRVTNTLRPLGFKLAPPIRLQTQNQAVVYDYSHGKYPLTAQWLAAFFHATVKPGPASFAGYTNGLLVVIGHDYAASWYGRPA
jgi:hypothetical protein